MTSPFAAREKNWLAVLCFPWPISEAQRLASPTYQGIEHSLEKDFPDVYGALLKVARDLVGKHEHDPQEIEFTFESASGKDLYILQKRAMVHDQQADAPFFDVSSPKFGPPVAVGMGVAGGAYSGRVAINIEQIEHLTAEAPDDNILLLRPDTVPEDITMITRLSGLLTAEGVYFSCGRNRETPRQDCRGGLPGIGGNRESGNRQVGGSRGSGWRLDIDRWAHRKIFLGRLPIRAHAGHTL